MVDEQEASRFKVFKGFFSFLLMVMGAFWLVDILVFIMTGFSLFSLFGSLIWDLGRSIGNFLLR